MKSRCPLGIASSNRKASLGTSIARAFFRKVFRQLGLASKVCAMTLSDQISEDIKNAMRAKDTITLTTLRALKSAIKNAAIEKGGADATLDDTETTNIIRKQIKQRQDSVAQFEQAKRLELVEKEKSEIEVLEKYLPKALSQEEIDQAVAESIAEVGATSRADMGKVMKVLQEKTGGRADGKTLSQAVQNKLA